MTVGDIGPYRGTAVSAGKVVPLISSYVTGPLGLLHLPRLWLKALLHARDMLAEDWGCGPGGLDKRIMEFIGVDGNVFIPWLAETLPTYDECEEWVRANASQLNAASIAASNTLLETMGLPRDLAPQFRAHLGIGEESTNVGIMLNNYDDWDTVHAYVSAHAGGCEPIVPAISPLTVGLLNAPQLPRHWIKAVLGAFSALPHGYALEHEDADVRAVVALGVDPAADRDYLRTERPTYVAYEAWIRARSTAVETDAAALTLDEPSVVRAHVYDWALLRDSVRAREAGTIAPGIHAFDRSGRLR
jgi:hypothetical protein